MQRKSLSPFRPPSADDPIVAEIVLRLVDAYHPDRIYLFGSVARGDAGTNSDYDLMVVLNDDAPPPLRSEDPGYRALWGTRAAADVLVWVRSDFEKQLHLKASFPSTIVREGRLLYEAA